MGHKVLQLNKALLTVGHPDEGKVLLAGCVHAQHHDVHGGENGELGRGPRVRGAVGSHFAPEKRESDATRHTSNITGNT